MTAPTRLAGAHHARCPKRHHPLHDCLCSRLDNLEEAAEFRIDVMRPSHRLAVTERAPSADDG